MFCNSEEKTMERSYAEQTKVEYVCTRCGHTQKSSVGYRVWYMPYIGGRLREYFEHTKCPECAGPIKISAVLCDMDGKYKFDVKKFSREAAIDWICANCGCILDMEHKGFEKIKDLREYIKFKKEKLIEDGCACGNLKLERTRTDLFAKQAYQPSCGNIIKIE